MIFLRKCSPIYALLHKIKDIFIKVTIEPKINTTQTRFSKNLAKSTLCSGPYKMMISVLLIRNTWNLVSVFEISIWNFQDFFLASIWTILTKFVKLACLEVVFPKVGIFGILFCNLQTRTDMSKKKFVLCLHMGKIW